MGHFQYQRLTDLRSIHWGSVRWILHETPVLLAHWCLGDLLREMKQIRKENMLRIAWPVKDGREQTSMQQQ
jgi:hypothetical protein